MQKVRAPTPRARCSPHRGVWARARVGEDAGAGAPGELRRAPPREADRPLPFGPTKAGPRCLLRGDRGSPLPGPWGTPRAGSSGVGNTGPGPFGILGRWNGPATQTFSKAGRFGSPGSVLVWESLCGFIVLKNEDWKSMTCAAPPPHREYPVTWEVPHRLLERRMRILVFFTPISKGRELFQPLQNYSTF